MYAFTHKDGTQIVAESSNLAEWLRDVALIEAVRHTDLTRHVSALSRSDTSETARPRHSRILQPQARKEERRKERNKNKSK
jgi:hypothetical protein